MAVFARRLAFSGGFEVPFIAVIKAHAKPGSAAIIRHTNMIGSTEEIVRILLARGADVNARDMEGWTAMRYATGYGYTEIAQLLAKAGARE